MKYVDKEKVVEEFLPVIKRIAMDLKRTLPPNVEMDDLIQEGVLALLSSVERYDPRKGSLRNFVLKRIRGAMLDYLRKMDWLPRNLRRNMKEIEETLVEFASEGIEATDEMISKKTGLDLETVKAVRREMVRKQMLMLDSYLLDTEESILDTVPAEEDPAKEAYKELLLEALKGAIEKLPEREKLVLSLRFEKELSLKEIGLVLGVTESRVSQMISSALAKIRRELEGMV